MNDYDPDEWLLTDAEQRDLYERGRADGCAAGLLIGALVSLSALFALASYLS